MAEEKIENEYQYAEKSFDFQETPSSYAQLLHETNYVLYPKNYEKMYEARLCNAAEKYKDALVNLIEHFK